ncbi:orotate phosphoribosyltransferase [Corticicoccus populi]|uniref:Orotate phosphoribosyltransferase n=1 Tax=Corticicoccus populi TaxID=1812821 RepID=A0ABW5WTR5_9STAP
MREQKVAEILLDIGAVKVQPENPFTWASGIVSPIYCDNRKIIGEVDARRTIAAYFKEAVNNLDTDVDIVAGTSTAGIPHAAFVSEALGLPMSYVRGSKKKHGTGEQIEGADVKGKKVVLIEDLISTGGSSIEAAEALLEYGAEVVCVLAIFTYNIPKARDNFNAKSLDFKTLSNIDALLEVSVERGDLTKESLQKVVDFRNGL